MPAIIGLEFYGINNGHGGKPRERDPGIRGFYIRHSRYGWKIRPISLMQAKSPAESRGNWDFFKLVGVVPADQAYRPLNEGHCPLVAG